MFVLPAEIPVTTPVLLLIVAIAWADELQTIVPMAVVLRVVVSPTHIVLSPVMAGAVGAGLTVMVPVLVTIPQPPVRVTV